MSDEARICDFAGHDFEDAGGGLEICTECETERQIEQADDHDRCFCGHFRCEHDERCRGAYGTLTPEVERAEVLCRCRRFSEVKANYHEVRT